MVDYLVWIWLAVAVVSALLEFATMQMVSIWFTFASIVAIILALCGVVWWVQVLVFCVLALVLLLALRKFSLKYLLKNNNSTTNVDSVVGTEHKLQQSISPDNAGALKINGVVWTAVCEDESASIEAGNQVRVVKVNGNKLVVVLVEKPENIQPKQKEKEVKKEKQK